MFSLICFVCGVLTQSLSSYTELILIMTVTNKQWNCRTLVLSRGPRGKSSFKLSAAPDFRTERPPLMVIFLSVVSFFFFFSLGVDNSGTPPPH